MTLAARSLLRSRPCCGAVATVLMFARTAGLKPPGAAEDSAEKTGRKVEGSTAHAGWAGGRVRSSATRGSTTGAGDAGLGDPGSGASPAAKAAFRSMTVVTERRRTSWDRPSSDRRSAYFLSRRTRGAGGVRGGGSTKRVLRLKQVQAQTGLSRSTIFALQQRGIFPQSIKIGPKATGWYEDEVQNYIETRPRGGDRAGKRR